MDGLVAKFDLLIRVDASPAMGAGHFMRCFSFAQYAIRRGWKVIFLHNGLLEGLKALLIENNFFNVQLMNESSSRGDANYSKQLAAKYGVQWILIDGYHFTKSFFDFFKNIPQKLMLIDDFGSIPSHVEMVINYQPWACASLYPANCKKFLGLNYFLLRQEFLNYDNFSKEKDTLKRVLVMMGGTDPHGISKKIKNFLSKINENTIEVLSIDAPNFIPVSNLIAKADIAISAGGSTCWELAFMQVPILVVVQAENQLPIAQYIEDTQLGINLGWHHQLEEKFFLFEVENLLKNEEKRNSMREAAKKLQIAKKVDEIYEFLFEEGKVNDSH